MQIKAIASKHDLRMAIKQRPTPALRMTGLGCFIDLDALAQQRNVQARVVLGRRDEADGAVTVLLVIAMDVGADPGSSMVSWMQIIQFALPIPRRSSNTMDLSIVVTNPMHPIWRLSCGLGFCRTVTSCLRPWVRYGIWPANACSSNGKMKGEGDTKNGNRYLAWAFVEAANFAIRYCEAARKFYQRKKAKRNCIVAIKAVAHKLARACFHMLKTGEQFSVERCFT
jgi:hypothetical protein